MNQQVSERSTLPRMMTGFVVVVMGFWGRSLPLLLNDLCTNFDHYQ